MTELAVLVPVLNRPQNVKPLVESFLEGCPEGSVLCFIPSAEDPEEMDAIAPFIGEHAGGRIVLQDRDWDGGTTWPQKINYAAGRIGNSVDWCLFAADDVRFVPGWWEATEELRADERIGVIGTNDSRDGTGNPRVAAGDHTCHPLVRSRYIRDHGTVDRRGEAVHGGYHHWFVDDELIWTAKLRNAWAYCPDAIVEHLHPYWGHGEWDDTYQRGEANAEADGALWRQRATELLGLNFQ